MTSLLLLNGSFGILSIIQSFLPKVESNDTQRPDRVAEEDREKVDDLVVAEAPPRKAHALDFWRQRDPARCRCSTLRATSPNHAGVAGTEWDEVWMATLEEELLVIGAPTP